MSGVPTELLYKIRARQAKHQISANEYNETITFYPFYGFVEGAGRAVMFCQKISRA